MPGAPTIGSIFTERLVVGVGDMAVSNRSNITVSTFALGSCVGIAAIDPSTKVGGIIHIMLPDSKLSTERSQKSPAAFANTGLPIFFQDLKGMGARPSNLKFFVAGGANVLNTGNDYFKIGVRNIEAVENFFRRNGFRARHAFTGGFQNRTIHLKLSTAEVQMKTPDGLQTFSLA